MKYAGAAAGRSPRGRLDLLFSSGGSFPGGVAAGSRAELDMENNYGLLERFGRGIF